VNAALSPVTRQKAISPITAFLLPPLPYPATFTSAVTFFKTQGTLPLDAPSYVERRADQQLFEALAQGRFCYILTSRQMGKSSLMVRTAQRLREQGTRVVQLDLQAIGVNLTPEQWYDGLVVKMGRQLDLEDELEDFWLDNERLGPVQRLFTALHDVALPNLSRAAGAQVSGQPKLVLFIDEIDVVKTLKFSTDEFFAAIREAHNGRSADPAWRDVTFALLGVATPAELIRDPAVTLFNLGQRVELTDFTPEEAAGLAHGLGRPSPEAGVLLQRVLRWTNGHPYLTQRLCQALAADPLLQHPTDVDRLCEELFLGRRACEQDENLLFVRERLLRSGSQRLGVVRLYEQVRNRRNIPDDHANPLVTSLHLAGIISNEHGMLVVRNRIYYHVFSKEWIRQTVESMGGAEPTTLAVLPFVDLSVERSDYLCDGLTDELINSLGQIPGLRVASRISSFQFKGKTGDVRDIGTQLGVNILLEGNVRLLGRRLKVTTRLVSTEHGHPLWSGQFKYSVEDIHLIQEEIARAIVEQLRPHLSHAPPATTTRTQAPQREAYHLYLKARYFWNQRHETSITRSVAFFEQAIQQDPDYAAAYAGLAEAHMILGIYNFRPPREVHPRAKEAAIRALEIDENLADAHSAMGNLYSVYDWDWVRAEQSFRRAISLNPSYANAHQWYGINCLTPLARHDEALSELRVAQELDPLSIRIAASIGLALHFAGRHDEAIAQCRYTIELEEGFWLTHLFLGCAQLAIVDLAGARRSFQSAVDLSQGDPGALAALAQCHAIEGRSAEAERILNGLLNLARVRYVPASEIACLYAGLHQPVLARQWMRKAQEEKSYRLIYLRVDPRFGEFQSEA
jgi:TolB-like protein/Flp pilus assembly protein TadD